MAFGGPSGYQRLRPTGIGHRIGQPDTVSASPMSCTSAPSTIGSPSHRYSWPGAVNSQSEPLPGLSSTPARIHALVAASNQTRTSALEPRVARHSRPSMASTMCANRIASTAQRPPVIARAEAPPPIMTAHSQVCVSVRCPPERRGSPCFFVAL